ncbi:MAG: T9SS type A sorting domain-containing protein, partial [Ignavibacteriaceae bacterium]|nr:T9SS type A sorting domain-containing protein [Ignavibacteriaceae bacterium]
FNPSTNIKYHILTAGMVSLKVYDILGREVATLVNEEKPAGSYEVEFSATALSSGIYFYRLTDGNFIQTNKMVLMK